MRLVIDLQACQGVHRRRGIGRYALHLALELARQVKAAGRHELWLLLKDRPAGEIMALRRAFADLVPPRRVLTFQAPGPSAASAAANSRRGRAAELLRGEVLAGLRPDLVLVSSMFEGLHDDLVTGPAPAGIATAAILYDLIPLTDPARYLPDQAAVTWYHRKLQALKNCDLLLAISEHSRQEAIDRLALLPAQVINISGAAADFFVADPDGGDSATAAGENRRRHGIHRPYVMYTGGMDPRKNMEGLLAAYADLPQKTRNGHQLVLVCRLAEEDRRRLHELAARHGLAPDELVLTGEVGDPELAELYRHCRLFVFPSKQEGFGLPALEAMCCGAPVIGADAGSVPEVIGHRQALFNPHERKAIGQALNRALNDKDFLNRLRRHGRRQAARFSWPRTAGRALAGLEQPPGDAGRAAFDVESAPKVAVGLPMRRPTLAYVSPLPPQHSGIADYSRELLPELARHYDIVLINDQDPADDWLKANFSRRDHAWLRQHGDKCERVLYNFGNSAFHLPMVELLAHRPGVVILHDFFLSGLQNWRQHRGGQPAAFARELFYAHGYQALLHRQQAGDEAAVWHWPCNRRVLDQAVGVVVHSHYALAAVGQWYGPDYHRGKWRRIPQLHAPATAMGRAEARAALGLDPEDFLLCSFGMVGRNKRHGDLLAAWLSSPLATDPRCRLVFVGEAPPKESGGALQEARRRGQVVITGYLPPETYHAYLAAADLAVQLRAFSRGETSRAALDCLAYGVPLVVNANGPMAELPPDAVVLLPDDCTVSQLAAKITELRREPEQRGELARLGRQYVRKQHHPVRVGDLLYRAVEELTAAGRPLRQRRTEAALSKIEAAEKEFAGRERSAAALAANRAAPSPPRLLVDISELARRDAKSGIQRVVRNILHCLPAQTPLPWRLEPIYWQDGEYRYARDFCRRFYRLPEALPPERAVTPAPGDIFLGLDLAPRQVREAATRLDMMRLAGTRLYFVVYDLLPLSQPQYFPVGAGEKVFRPWLETVNNCADGLICISQTVADELRQWRQENICHHRRDLSTTVSWFHLGAELETTEPAAAPIPEELPFLLMVGTLEPRKGHAQVLDACQRLWEAGEATGLVIVGKEGWLVEELAQNLRRHPEAGKRLFWLESPPDDLLEDLYRRALALVAASRGEGFGLPLIEAARRGLPLVVRDLPVFREIAGPHAWYFQADDGEQLARALARWLELHRAGQAPASRNLPRLNWRQSTAMLLARLGPLETGSKQP